jgi:hypothetical protein
MDTNCITTAQSTAGIPVGIAVARQRLQETQCQSPLQPKDITRFGLGFSDLGKCKITNFSKRFQFTIMRNSLNKLLSYGLLILCLKFFPKFSIIFSFFYVIFISFLFFYSMETTLFFL